MRESVISNFFRGQTEVFSRKKLLEKATDLVTVLADAHISRQKIDSTILAAKIDEKRSSLQNFLERPRSDYQYKLLKRTLLQTIHYFEEVSYFLLTLNSHGEHGLPNVGTFPAQASVILIEVNGELMPLHVIDTSKITFEESVLMIVDCFVKMELPDHNRTVFINVDNKMQINEIDAKLPISKCCRIYSLREGGVCSESAIKEGYKIWADKKWSGVLINIADVKGFPSVEVRAISSNFLRVSILKSIEVLNSLKDSRSFREKNFISDHFTYLRGPNSTTRSKADYISRLMLFISIAKLCLKIEELEKLRISTPRK